MAGVAAEVIELPYKPRTWAKGFHASLKRWAALVLHRRAGKTTAVLNHHVRAALDDDWETRRLRFLLPDITQAQLKDLLRRRVYWHVMPTYHQGKLTGAWDTLKEITAPIDGATPNESELLVKLGNGNKIQIIGGDKPDSLRGPALSGLSLDEFSQIPSNAFSEVLSKSLADHVGYAIFSGTIKGADQLFQTYEAARKSSEWFALWQAVDVSLDTEEGATIMALTRAMEDDRKLVVQGLMTQGEFDQEWFLSREAAIRGAFYGAELKTAREQGRIRAVPYSTALAVDTDWDLGIDAMAVWFSQSEPGGAVRVIDYHEDVGGGLPAMIKVVKDKPYVYGEHWAPHDIEVREISSGATRKQAAAGMGINFRVTPKIAVADGITAAQLMLARCWFDEEKCKAGLEALLHYRRTWNQRLSMFTQEPVHDWACFTVDTEVLTHSGTYRIMDLPENGEVLTPCGWRQYQGPRITQRNARLVEVAFSDGSTVRCTPDHLFLTDSGWRSAEFLVPDTLIQSCSTLSANTSTAGFIGSGRESITSLAVDLGCIVMSGAQRLGRSLAGATFTTGMGTLATMPWPISNACPQPNISQWSGTATLESGEFTSPTLPAQPQQSGTNRMLEGHGIGDRLDARNPGRNGSERSVPAIIAERLWKCWCDVLAILRSTVPIPARRLHIVRVRRLSERADTCCIHVPEVECFALANGAIVHNSHGADAFRGLAVRHKTPERERKDARERSRVPRDWAWS